MDVREESAAMSKNIGYADIADILRSAVIGGACPNCYSTTHRDCSGEDDECRRVDSSSGDVAKICGHERYLHSKANEGCESCDCHGFSEEEKE